MSSNQNREYKGLINFLASILAIIAGLLFGLLVLFISNPEQAIPGFINILQGGFSDGLDGISRFVYFATPIIMTGLAVGFAFKTGLFNIGASGQFIMGAYVAVYIGVKWTFLPESIHWLVAIIFAGIAGALWGAIPGLLKAFSNVNEVISSIMTNYISMHLVNMWIVENIFDQAKNQSMAVSKSAVLPTLGIEGSHINIGIVIAILSVIFLHILLEKTTFGYELKACGQNPNASKYAGINSKKNIVLAMMIAGLFAGIGGGITYLYGAGRYIQVLDVISSEGFTGIAVALFGQSNPLGILLSGLFIAHIELGGNTLQLYGYAPEIIDIIIASIIYFGAFSLLFKNFIQKIIQKLLSKKKGGN